MVELGWKELSVFRVSWLFRDVMSKHESPGTNGVLHYPAQHDAEDVENGNREEKGVICEYGTII